MANQPPQAGVDPQLVQQVIQDASMMEQEGQTRVMISRQLFQQLQAALQTYYGNSKQVDKMFEVEEGLTYLSARLDDQIELGSGGIAHLGRKAKGLLKRQQRVARAKELGKRVGMPGKNRNAAFTARIEEIGQKRAETLARRKGRIVQYQGSRYSG
jgi:hypothetical protein